MLPVYTQICVPGGTAIINGNCSSGTCPVAVTRSNWSQVKNLYD